MRKWIIRTASSELIKNFLIYSLGALFVKGVSFFLLPLYTSLLSPEEYGVVDLLSTFSNLIDVGLSLGLFQLVFMEYFHVDQEARNKLIRTIITVFVRISGVLYLVVLVMAVFFGQYIFGDVKSIWIVLVMCTNYLTFFQGLVILILKLDKKAAAVTAYQVAYGILSILLNVYTVYSLRKGVDGIIWSNFIAVACAFLFAMYVLHRKSGFLQKLNRQELKDVLKMSLPFVPNALAIWTMISLNRWMLLHYCDLYQVGIFSVALKFSSLFDPLLIQPFLSAYTPRTLERFAKGEYGQSIIKYGMGALLFFGISGIVLRIIASYMIDPAFDDALNIIFPLSIANAFVLMTSMSNIMLIHKKKVKVIVLSVMLGTLANVLATYLLVQGYLAMGAAFAALIGNMVWMTATMYFALKEKRMISQA